MKIKVAFLDLDASYLKRLVAALGTRYLEQIEAYSFTDVDKALQYLNASRIDVFVASDDFNLDLGAIPKRCGFAWFVNSPDVERQGGFPAICKYQKIELIYRQILGVYAEIAPDVSRFTRKDGSSSVILFSSPAGGVGTSSLAAAAAVHFASVGKRCLYLDLEPYGTPDVFFSGAGQANMSDVIFALKSGKTNLSLKIESCVRQDASGVWFYSKPKIALDIMELRQEEIIHLLQELQRSGRYDYIIADMAFGIDEATRNVFRQAHVLVWVSDGGEIANAKVRSAYESLTICEQGKDASLTDQICLAYNRFSSKTGKNLDDLPVKTIGGARRYENRSGRQVIIDLATTDMFDKIWDA